MEEKKPLKIKFKTAVILIITAVVLLGIGANVYASVNGYGNIFFLIKYLVTGEKTEITGKDELLSDRDITISYEPITLTKDIKLQIRNLQIKNKEAKLMLVVSEINPNDVAPLKYKVYNNENKVICEQNSIKSENSTQYTEELKLNEFNNDKIIYLEVANSKNEKITQITINLETREISVEGEKEAVEKISEIKLKEFLGYVSALESRKDSIDEKILFSQAMLTKYDYEESEYKYLEIVNLMLESCGYEKIPSSYSGECFKIVKENGIDVVKVVSGRGGFIPNKVLEIKDISYCGGIYTAKFNYAFIGEDETIVNYENLDIKEATVEFELNANKDYSEFKVIKFEGTEDNKENDYIENNELIGSWEPTFAKENGKEISLMDIYGSAGVSGAMNFESNGKYTAFVGVYSSENEDDMQGDYINNKTSITLIANSGKKEILVIKEIGGTKYLEKEIDTTNRYVYFKKSTPNNSNNENLKPTENGNNMSNTNKTITQLSPSGFSGSSMHRVELNANKELYVITFDGNGYSENNIKSRELIAKNVESISKNSEGSIIIKGGEKVKTTFNWIIFEQENNYTKTEREKAVEAIKNKLIDKNWLKDNTLIKSANGNSKSIQEQDYRFAVIKEQDTKKPVVVLVVTAENILTQNTFIVRYKNNNVNIEKVAGGHYQHGGTLTNENYYATTYAHMREWAFELLEVTSDDIGVVARNHGTAAENDYDYIEILNFEKNNNLKYVDTELNETNLNKLLK